MNKKICSKCGEEKELSAFAKDKHTKSMLNYSCRACTKLYRELNEDRTKDYREANKDKLKDWRELNKVKTSAYNRSYRELNEDRLKINQKAYRELNKDKMKAYEKIWRAANKRSDYYKVRVRKLANSYVAGTLQMKVSECPQMLIEAKRAQLKLLRLVNQD